MTDPVTNPRAPRQIPVAKPSLGEVEATAVRDAILSGWASGGTRVAEFELTFAKAHGKRHGVACNSGTTALHLALAAFNVRAGDEVVIPTGTMVAVANAVLYCGATPVFVDSEPESGNPDPVQLERALSPRTAAIIVPHLYGVPALGFIAACREHAPHVPLIEDCAESHFATTPNGAPAGSLGWLACWSFYGNKIATTGEGGLVATNDGHTADRLRSLRAHAFTPGNHFHHREMAFGYRMTEMQAALGLAQLSRKDELLGSRTAIYQRYVAGLCGLPVKLQARTAGSVPWVFPLICRSEEARDKLRGDLANDGIETRSFFWPLHVQPHLRRYADRGYPVAEDLGRRGAYLPLFPDLDDESVDVIIESARGSLA